jgi:hypothetical protein
MKNKINGNAVDLIVGIAAVFGVMTILFSAVGMIIKLTFG